MVIAVNNYKKSEIKAKIYNYESKKVCGKVYRNLENQYFAGK